MIIISTNPKNQLLQKVEEELDFLGKKYEVKKSWTDEQMKGFYLGNALKYLLRHQKKNGLEDLKKARKNLDWLIEEMEAED